MAEFDFAYFQLLYKIMAHQTGSISRVAFKPQKPAFEGRPIPQQFPRATPESQGISSDHVRAYLEALACDQYSKPHHVMIMRHGFIIAECSFFPYENGVWHITHSMCKSVTGMAVGLAIDEGLLSLDEKLADIFADYTNVINRIRRQSPTIENLLNMTSGVSFSESGAISGNNWRSGYMNAGRSFEPGEKFEYNSMNSYMLSAAIQEKTGITMMDYLRPRLFEPLGIDEVFWEKCPQGVTKGGWGMFIKPEDAMKLGCLYLHKGVWRGKQIIPADWVETSTKKHSDGGDYGYGYQIWMDERPGSFAFNGLFGQDVIIEPDIDFVHMINASSSEIFMGGDLTDIMRNFWGAGFDPSDEPLPENPEAYHRLIQTEMNLHDGLWKPPLVKHRDFWVYPAPDLNLRPLDVLRMLTGYRYKMENGTIGVFPLICQVMHNNFTEGIREIGFEEENGEMIFLVREGETQHRMKVGFEHAQTGKLMLHGEPYAISVTGRITSDERRRFALLLTITYLEECCTRDINLFFSGKDVEMRADEHPGDKVIMEALDYTGGNAITENRILRRVVPDGTLNIVDDSMYSTINPVDVGHLVENEKTAPKAIAKKEAKHDR